MPVAMQPERASARLRHADVRSAASRSASSRRRARVAEVVGRVHRVRQRDRLSVGGLRAIGRREEEVERLAQRPGAGRDRRAELDLAARPRSRRAAGIPPSLIQQRERALAVARRPRGVGGAQQPGSAAGGVGSQPRRALERPGRDRVRGAGDARARPPPRAGRRPRRPDARSPRRDATPAGPRPPRASRRPPRDARRAAPAPTRPEYTAARRSGCRNSTRPPRSVTSPRSSASPRRPSSSPSAAHASAMSRRSAPHTAATSRTARRLGIHSCRVACRTRRRRRAGPGAADRSRGSRSTSRSAARSSSSASGLPVRRAMQQQHVLLGCGIAVDRARAASAPSRDPGRRRRATGSPAHERIALGAARRRAARRRGRRRAGARRTPGRSRTDASARCRSSTTTATGRPRRSGRCRLSTAAPIVNRSRPSTAAPRHGAARAPRRAHRPGSAGCRRARPAPDAAAAGACRTGSRAPTRVRSHAARASRRAGADGVLEQRGLSDAGLAGEREHAARSQAGRGHEPIDRLLLGLPTHQHARESRSAAGGPRGTRGVPGCGVRAPIPTVEASIGSPIEGARMSITAEPTADRHRQAHELRLPRRRRGRRDAQRGARRHGRQARLLPRPRRARPEHARRSWPSARRPPSRTPASG